VAVLDAIVESAATARAVDVEPHWGAMKRIAGPRSLACRFPVTNRQAASSGTVGLDLVSGDVQSAGIQRMELHSDSRDALLAER
jgi:hypothetical protein